MQQKIVCLCITPLIALLLLAPCCPYPDSDGDRIGDTCDNCPHDPNRDQIDFDNDTVGDACDTCPELSDPEQADADADKIGDLCDTCPVLYGATNFGANCAWNTRIGGSRWDEGRSAIELADGSFIVVGSTYSEGAGDYDLWLIKLAPDGQELWRKTFGGAKGDSGKAVKETSDGGLIIAGATASFGAGGSDAWLIKTDADGNEEWNQTYGSLSDDYGWEVIETSDHFFLMIGDTYSFGSGADDLYLVKTDSAGNLIWEKTFGDLGSDYGTGIAEASDGNYVLVGATQVTKADETDVWLLKVNQDGTDMWTKTFGSSGSDNARGILATADGDFIIAGLLTDVVRGDEDIWLLKTDAEGNEIWSSTFGTKNADKGVAVAETVDGGFIVTGYWNSYKDIAHNVTVGDLFLLKTNSDGLEEWTTLYGQKEDYDRFDMGFGLSQSRDGGFIVTGQTKTFASTNSVDYYDLWTIRTDAQGQAPQAPAE
jgi:hypothetical protein